ncbi:hypothetical protein L596_015659 [Steinernema carpocapsae]|uniref:G-protein coupled receptors family 1 profile domain-containing protein n=1 Tax=Steinernema carpocapsae TaxID=34508 RepID=A0A4U5NGN0_STECR|nr:hypothetical protein L596_015659 [Steinernema carpocapsae]
MNCDQRHLVGGIDDTVKFFLSLIFVIVGIAGVFGNLLTVVVIYKTPSLQSHTNYFLASLATSDLLLIVVGVPFDLFYLWRKSYAPAFAGYCEFTSTSISLFTFASILTIVMLTLERYVAICYPFSLRALFDKGTVKWIIYSTWIIAFFPSLYIGLQFKPVSKDFCGYNREVGSGMGSCDYVASETFPFPYTFELMLLLTFVLPVMFIIFCYVRILYTLNEMSATHSFHPTITSQNSDSSTAAYTSGGLLQIHVKQPGPPKSHKAQKMVIKMLVLVTAVFFICYLPYHVERLIVQYTREECDKSLTCLLLYPITGLLQYISATLNPIFYSMMSVRFRSAFMACIKKVCSSRGERRTRLPMRT